MRPQTTVFIRSARRSGAALVEGGPIARSTAREIIKTYGVWIHQATTVETITRAREISDLARISFRAALIVASAEEVDADELLSEDLNAGRSIVGIRVVTPLDGGYMGLEIHDGR